MLKHIPMAILSINFKFLDIIEAIRKPGKKNTKMKLIKIL